MDESSNLTNKEEKKTCKYKEIKVSNKKEKKLKRKEEKSIENIFKTEWNKKNNHKFINNNNIITAIIIMIWVFIVLFMYHLQKNQKKTSILPLSKPTFLYFQVILISNLFEKNFQVFFYFTSFHWIILIIYKSLYLFNIWTQITIFRWYHENWMFIIVNTIFISSKNKIKGINLIIIIIIVYHHLHEQRPQNSWISLKFLSLFLLVFIFKYLFPKNKKNFSDIFIINRNKNQEKLFRSNLNLLSFLFIFY